MIIYKTTNIINGKIYIGQDSFNNANYIGSGINIKRAIKKYGIENFKKDIIEMCNTKSELNEREIYWIKFYNSKDPKIGYNIADGGFGGIMCDSKLLSGENYYLNKMNVIDKENHLNKFRRGENYWKSKGFKTQESINLWIKENLSGSNHSHKKNKSYEEYIQWRKSSNIGENIKRSDLIGKDRDDFFRITNGGKNNPIFRGKSDEEIEIWLNEHRRGENGPNAKFEYEITTNDNIKYVTKSLKSFCKEHDFNYMTVRSLANKTNIIPKLMKYRGWIVTKRNRTDKLTRRNIMTNTTETIKTQLEQNGYDFAIAVATQAEIENGAACGQLSVITECMETK